MMKRSLFVFVLALMMSAITFGQSWTFQGRFTAEKLNTISGVQYLVVTPDSKVWVSPFQTPSDSLWVPDSGKYKRIHPIYVYNNDGTINDTIKSITVNGQFMPMYGSGYGLALDHNGNVLVSKFGNLYRIDYQTHLGMNILQNPFNGGSMVTPAASSDGSVFIAAVLAGSPIKILNEDFSFNSNAVDTLPNIGRYMTVSQDGNTIYAPRYTSTNIIRFRRASSFDPYIQDTCLTGAAVESGVWDTKDPKKLWLSIGSIFTPATGNFSGREFTWIMFDTATWAMEDSIRWHFAGDRIDERPRGIAFDKFGNAFLAEFNISSDTVIQKWNNPQHIPTAVKDENNNVVVNYNLGQNYPNPFNPTTNINFAVKNAGFVSLKVFNMLGQVVATLVDGQMAVGNYTATFDASKLSSGIYIYQLQAGNVKISKKMTLMK